MLVPHLLSVGGDGTSELCGVVWFLINTEREELTHWMYAFHYGPLSTLVLS